MCVALRDAFILRQTINSRSLQPENWQIKPTDAIPLQTSGSTHKHIYLDVYTETHHKVITRFLCEGNYKSLDQTIYKNQPHKNIMYGIYDYF